MVAQTSPATAVAADPLARSAVGPNQQERGQDCLLSWYRLPGRAHPLPKKNALRSVFRTRKSSADEVICHRLANLEARHGSGSGKDSTDGESSSLN